MGEQGQRSREVGSRGPGGETSGEMGQGAFERGMENQFTRGTTRVPGGGEGTTLLTEPGGGVQDFFHFANEAGRDPMGGLQRKDRLSSEVPNALGMDGPVSAGWG